MSAELDILWSSLCQIYGRRVSDAYGPEMPPIWRMKLAVCTTREINRAIEYFATQGGAFPPTLPEVWQACAHRAPQSAPRLAERPASEVALLALGNIREITRRKPDDPRSE